MRNGKRKTYNENLHKGIILMSNLRSSLVSLLYEVGNQSGCHQMPERSFFYKGRQFPVCARCTGVALGQLTAVVMNILFKIPFSFAIVMLGIMGVDWSLQEFGFKKSTNPRRLATGFLGGFGLFSIYAIFIRKIWKLFKK